MTLDYERLPFEIRRALTAAGHAVEFLEPGLQIRHDGDTYTVISHDGTIELASFPVYRLHEVNMDKVEATGRELANRLPPADRDQIEAAVAARHVEVVAPVNEDYVYVLADGEPWFFVHRWVVVDGWVDRPSDG